VNDELSTPEQREALMVAERKGRKAVQRVSERLGRLEIEWVKLNDLRPNPWNPNRQSEHDFELLLRSMEEDGFTQPVVAVRIGQKELDEDEHLRGHFEPGMLMIVDGEHRWRAANRLGLEEIPVVVTPMTVAQMRISTLRHNRARGSEDIELTAEVLRDLQQLGALDWAQDSLMIDDIALQRLLDDIAAPEALAGEDYGEGWVPDSGKDGRGREMTVEMQQGHGGGGTEWGNAATAQAVEHQREREQKLKDAKTEEQREMIRRDSARDFFRLSLIFAGDEARIVKAVLGGAPAETVIDLCRRESGELDRALEEGWVTIDSVIGSRVIPAEAAKVISDALDLMDMSGDLGDKNRWQGLEYMAAEYASGAHAAAQSKEG
jgi:hypothetical protein